MQQFRPLKDRDGTIRKINFLSAMQGRTVQFCLLAILAGDVETNPGPATAEQLVSFLHFNIRSIRSKLDYIKTNF